VTTVAEYVETTVSDGIARLTIDRAERHNSLIPALLDDLYEAIVAAGEARPFGHSCYGAPGRRSRPEVTSPRSTTTARISGRTRTGPSDD